MKTIEDKRTVKKFMPCVEEGNLFDALKMINEHCYISSELRAELCGHIGRLDLYEILEKNSGNIIKWYILKKARRYLIGVVR